VLFRAESLTAAMEYFRSMFGLASSGDVPALLGALIYTPYHMLVLFICAFLVFQPLQAHDWALKPITWPRAAAVVPLFVFALMAMYTQAFNPFLYFQF
jgi:alginate O-acetyltransferase complex protein AlgI